MGTFLTAYLSCSVVMMGVAHRGVKRSGGWTPGRVAVFLIWGPWMLLMVVLCAAIYHYDRLRARLPRRR